MSNQTTRSQLSALADKWDSAYNEGGLLMLAIDGDDYNLCCTGNFPLLAAVLARLIDLNPALEDVMLRAGELYLRRKRLINEGKEAQS